MFARIIFYISLVATIFLGIRVIRILVNDIPRLTEWGYGYLTGKVVLLVIFGVITIFSYRKMKKESKQMH